MITIAIIAYIVIALVLAGFISKDIAWSFLDDRNQASLKDHKLYRTYLVQDSQPRLGDYFGGAFLGTLAGLFWPIFLCGAYHFKHDTRIIEQKKANEARQQELKELEQELETDFDRKLKEAVKTVNTAARILDK